MSKFGKIFSVVILLFVISNTVICTVLADEISHPIIGPSYLAITNVRNGSEFRQEIFIYNLDNIDHIVKLNFTGDIKNWITFYKLSNLTIPITSIYVNKSSYSPVLLKVTVPSDVANGFYYGNISAVFEEINISETGVNVQLTGVAPVFLEVTGEQILNISINSISINDVENGFKAKIKIDFQNTGNVYANPRFEVTFNRVGSGNTNDLKITSNDYNFPSIRPGESGIYNMEWDTGKAQLTQYGNYTAFFNITLEGRVVYEKTLNFEIFDKGSRLRDGRIDEILLYGIPEKGEYAIIITNFTNTGQIDINSQFNGSVYRDGNLIKEFISPQINVDINEKAQFESNMTILVDGNYVVKGHVYYCDTKNFINGETEELEVKFSVGFSIFGIDLFTFIVIIIIFIIIFFLIGYKRRSSKPKKINNKIKAVNKKITESKKSTRSIKSKGRIRIGRNKEKSPFKAFQENNTKKNKIITKKSEK